MLAVSIAAAIPALKRPNLLRDDDEIAHIVSLVVSPPLQLQAALNRNQGAFLLVQAGQEFRLLTPVLDRDEVGLLLHAGHRRGAALVGRELPLQPARDLLR